MTKVKLIKKMFLWENLLDIPMYSNALFAFNLGLNRILTLTAHVLDKWLNPSALIGGRLAWFASKRGRNRNIGSPGSHWCCVTARANRARKQSQPGAFDYFWRSKSNTEQVYLHHILYELGITWVISAGVPPIQSPHCVPRKTRHLYGATKCLAPAGAFVTRWRVTLFKIDSGPVKEYSLSAGSWTVSSPLLASVVFRVTWYSRRGDGGEARKIKDLTACLCFFRLL